MTEIGIVAAEPGEQGRALVGSCLERRLELYLDEPGGTLEWEPTEDCEEGNTGAAVLIGDEVPLG